MRAGPVVTEPPPVDPLKGEPRRLGVTEVVSAPLERIRSLRTQQRAWANRLAILPVPSCAQHYCCTSRTRGATAIGRPTGQCSTRELHRSMNICAWLWTSKLATVLLRKEVIQPHLPVRLPCYDFVPIADPTFDSSLSYELGHWLRVLPTFVT